MRHRQRKLTLNRFTSWRKSTLNNILKSLLIHQSIRTTSSKAKAAQPLAEKLISIGKKNTLAARRQAYNLLGSHRLVNLLFNDISIRFNQRAGGYTRIISLGSRRGDNADIVILELSEIKKKEIVRSKKEKIEKPLKEIPAEDIKTDLKETEEPKAQAEIKERPPITKKPTKKFFKGLRQIFKKERDSL
jgi:large subunit ribosomal protein L17